MEIDKKDVGKYFANFLHKKRLALGMNFKEFSTLMFGSENFAGYLSDVEKHKRGITLKTLGIFLEKLNCSFTVDEF